MKAPKFLYSVLLLLLVNTACEKMDDFYLSGSVFIEDPYYPGLPIYSEWGYNTFGAYIDREPYVSSLDVMPMKMIVNNDMIHMIFRGRMGSSNVDLTISFDGFSPQTSYDLTMLDDTTINLKESGRAVTLKFDHESPINLEIIEGELNIDRVQRLYVDEDLSRTIMSGYFQFKTFLDNEPVAISQGRFDLGIGYENFYNY
jgi:hypothetical protein